MNSITVKNGDGETIEVRRRGTQIEVRHPDIDKERFGRFVEVSPQSWQKAESHAKRLKLEIGDEASLAAWKREFGQHLILDGESYVINADEAKLIKEAARKIR